MRGEKRMQVLKNQPLGQIPGYKKVKLTDMGNVKEIMYIEKLHLDGFPIKKISKNEYMVISTGEVLEYQNHSENRSENKDGLRKTFKKIRELINTNFEGNKNELAFTITYAENMTDSKVLYVDFKNFIKRLKYKYSNIDYMSVVEPQERGAWHCHVLLRFNDLKKVYIPNKEIADLWGHGFVQVKAIRSDIDNMGAYLSAYLGDVPVDFDDSNNIAELMKSGIIKIGESVNVKEVEIDGKKKKFIKGGRLNLYPTGMNIYRCSVGIKKPTKTYMTYDNAKKIVGAVTPNYSTSIKILDDDNKHLNTISYEHYNLKRK
jgi:hypothetical protein